MISKIRIAFSSVVLVIAICPVVAAQTKPVLPTENEPVGERPYEMVNAGRNTDTRDAFVDFENLDGWVVETAASEAEFRKSRRQQLWGHYVGHLKYRGTDGENATSFVTVKPPEPMPIPQPFDSLTFWVYGNNWEWERIVIPRVQLVLLCENANGETIRVPLDTVRWKEWFLVHHKFQPETLARLGEAPKFVGLEIRGGTNPEFAELFFDNLAFYVEQLTPLSFAPRPKRPLTYPEGQTTGTNIGPGVLPFPTREETLLPGNFAPDETPQYARGKVVPLLEPTVKRKFAGTTASDMADSSSQLFGFVTDGMPLAMFNGNPAETKMYCGRAWHDVCAGARIGFDVPDDQVEKELLDVEADRDGDDDIVRARWRYVVAGRECLVEWSVRTWGNSLVIDLKASGGMVREVSFGTIKPQNDWAKPEYIPVPYLAGAGTNRPMVAMVKPDSTSHKGPENFDTLAFHLGTIDHMRSNASEFFFRNTNIPEVRYRPKTDGTYNDCYERFFVTMSPKFAEVLPNVSNPVSPWRDVTGNYVWRAHGANDRDRDYAFWKKMHRYGLRKVIINDHESGWRDGGESFTFRTDAAPKKGGDAGQLEYAKRLHELGFYYGPYNNYTDYAPVNAYWNEDWVTRLPDGQWRSAWARCYNPKPQIAVQAEREIAEIVQRKFGFNTAYCDVHTAVTPWFYVDYDHRVPGAGTLAATFFAYGEIMMHQKQTWGGPVYSEGNNHWYYCGLTDGNYAQDQPYFAHNPNAPWLVDFDLLKLRPLGNHFGMGNLDMFYGHGFSPANRQDYEKKLDCFIAATVAFGHSGFLETRDVPSAVRSYFLTQGLSERIGTQNVKSIRYRQNDLSLVKTEEALANGSYKNNRLEIVYNDGLMVYVNGNHRPSWGWGAYPPYGFCVVDPHEKLTVHCMFLHGSRFDYTETPDYIYADGRGTLRHYQNVLTDGQLIVLKNKNEPWEIIPVRESDVKCKTFAVQLPDQRDADVIALDYDRNELGPAESQCSLGMVYITPRDDEFSYLLKPKATNLETLTWKVPKNACLGPEGEFPRYVFPGMKISLDKENYTVPEDAKHDSLYWIETPKGPCGFVVVPFCTFSAEHVNHADQVFVLLIHSNLIGENTYFCKWHGIDIPDQTLTKYFLSTRSMFALPKNLEPGVREIEFEVTNKSYGNEYKTTKSYRLVTEKRIREDKWSPEFEVEAAIRGGERQSASETASGSYARRERVTCGGETRDGWAVHPPYIGGVGYTCMLSEPFEARPNQQIRAAVGIRDGGDASDGITYKIIVSEENSQENCTETEIASVHHEGRRWSEISGDLSPWAGRKIRLLLVSDVGPNDNSSADWACLADLRLCGIEEELISTLQEVTTSQK